MALPVPGAGSRLRTTLEPLVARPGWDPTPGLAGEGGAPWHVATLRGCVR
jgi:hypothetical protein